MPYLDSMKTQSPNSYIAKIYPHIIAINAVTDHLSIHCSETYKNLNPHFSTKSAL